ncbi:TIM-barrel domain-containing protein [Sphingobium aquiterrae]|uniref:glycoside hydrolase family 31 protein n=1 Tax=Sphingobium aquiterrae TaxID=2038656 RepID=UPI0030171F71
MTEPLTRREGLKALALGSALLAAKGPARALALDSGPVELRLAAIAPGLIRISLLPIVDGIAQEPVPTGSLAERAWPAPQAKLRAIEPDQQIACAGLSLTLQPTPLSIRIADAAGTTVQELRWEEGALDFRLGHAPLLGMGQGGPGFDRRGNVDVMRSGQGGYKLRTHGARVPIQWLVGTEGWAMFVHQPVGAFDLSGSEGRFLPTRPEEPIDLFLAVDRDPAGLLRAYAEITGYPQMPPLWSLGYQQSHRTLGTPEEILAEAREFRERKLPCDAMIYLGTGFCPSGWNTDNGEFGWNAKAFPDPPKAIKALHDEGFKVVLHVVIEGKRMTGGVTDPCTAPPLPSGRLPDGSWPPDRQVSCYWPHHKPLADLGIDGWWPDQGDGLDPPSRLARNRMYFEGQQLWRPGRRVYALHRNGFAGMQRFASFLWSGDVESRWETLANHVPIAVNTGLSGIPYWGTDIGGFVPTEEYSGELFARWFQFAAFNPLFRSHGRDWRMHMPWGFTKGERGYAETPKWQPDPASLKDDRIEPICRRYLELRYRLLPYLYTATHESVTTGMPIIRAMWLHFPDDPQAVARGDQYLFGADLLVAPVVEKGATARTLYLPRGRWYDHWTGEALEGGREVTRPVDLATMPVYVRAGAVLPLDPVRQHSGERTSQPTTLVVHPGADGTATIYEDDGDSFAYAKGAFSRIELHWSDAARTLRVTRGHGTPARRTFAVRMAGQEGTRPLSFDGRSATITL